MAGYFWNTVLAMNSVIWFASVAFITYGFGMLLVRLEWKTFLLSVAIFAVVSLNQLVITGLAHD
jgi:hypothetical protein